MKILHICIGLNIGGAELMLKRLVETGHRQPDCRHTVISLTSIGKVGQQLLSQGVEVHALEMRSPLDILRVLMQLVRLIRRYSPDIIQTWMYHADLLGALAGFIAGNRNVIWGVRCSAIPQSGVSLTKLVVTVCSWLSRILPAKIVCCAESARLAHAGLGYDQNRMLVIPNGYDLSEFKRDTLVRQQMRAAFGFGAQDLVIGTVGRFDPLKDYANFVRAALELAEADGRVRFLMVGRDMDGSNVVLNSLLAGTGHAEKFVLAGERDDVGRCLACLDIFCLSSVKEGFPNVVCEAMAMHVPCVVTDAGDAAVIVADTGTVVPTGNSAALAEALRLMIGRGDAGRTVLGTLARKRVESQYSIEIASARFSALYARLIAGEPETPSI